MDPQETRIYTAVIIAGLVIGIIIVYFTVSIIRQQKRNFQLQRESILVEMAAMERERTRIAFDLHDDVGPLLSVIKFQIDSVESANEEDSRDLIKATEQLDELIGRMRTIAVNLMPTALLRKGLQIAAAEFLLNAEEASKINISFSYKATTLIQADTSNNIFRILQETVHNAIKHADAKNIVVSIVEENNTLSILIKDDGKGFLYEEVKSEVTGFGLRSLKNRTEMMKGIMKVESKVGMGSAFLFQIPLSS